MTTGTVTSTTISLDKRRHTTNTPRSTWIFLLPQTVTRSEGPGQNRFGKLPETSKGDRKAPTVTVDDFYEPIWFTSFRDLQRLR